MADLVASAPALELISRRASRMWPTGIALHAAFRWLIALGPFYGLLPARGRPPGDVIRLEFTRGEA